MPVVRSSLPEVLYKKDVLRNFAKFAGKHLCQSLFLIKLQTSAYQGVRNVNFSENFAYVLNGGPLMQGSSMPPPGTQVPLGGRRFSPVMIAFIASCLH